MPNRIEIGKDVVSASSAGVGTLSSAGVATLLPKGLMQPFYAEEEMTLSTSGATTDSTGKLLPANSIIMAVTAYVTETINLATNWALGDGTTTARFLVATTDLTAGTTKVGMSGMFGVVSTTATGPTQAAAASLRITTTGTQNTTGKVRVCVHGFVFTPPAS